MNTHLPQLSHDFSTLTIGLFALPKLFPIGGFELNSLIWGFGTNMQAQRLEEGNAGRGILAVGELMQNTRTDIT